MSRSERNLEIVKLKDPENHHTWKFALANIFKYKQLNGTIVSYAAGTGAKETDEKKRAQAFSSVRLEDCGSSQSYIKQIKSAANKLTGSGFKLVDEWFASIMLAGLTDVFKPLFMGIEPNNEKITSDTVTGKLLDLQSSNGWSKSAFYTKNMKWNKKKSDKKCFDCGSTQNFSKQCDKKGENKNNDKKTW